MSFDPGILRWAEQKSFVAEKSRILYVATPKVACTTIRTGLIVLEGASRSKKIDPHNVGSHTIPSLANISVAESEFVLGSPEWIRFCVTRRPYERLVSAWLSKIFLGDAVNLTLPFAAELRRTRDVGSLFREFVKGLESGSPLFFRDEHFAPQVVLLGPEDFPYTHVLDLPELASFASWARSSDPSRKELDLSVRTNASLRVPLRAMYDRSTAEIVESLYEDDFTQFGYEREDFGERSDEFLLTENELSLVELLAASAGELHAAAALASMASSRVGGRYALSELLRAFGKRTRLSR